MTKLERVTGITLLTALVLVMHVEVFDYVYERASVTVNEIAKAIAP